MNNNNKMLMVNLARNEAPKFTENKNSDWVKYGENNIYPEKLLEMSNNSSIHRSILQTKIDMVIGEGIVNEDGSEVIDEVMLMLDEELEKISNDLIIFGGFCVEVIWSKNREKISSAKHIPFIYIRSGKYNDDGEIEDYFYSRNWNNYRREEYKPFIIPAFNEKKAGKEPKQLIYVKHYNVNSDYYPLPSYVSAQNWIDIHTRLGNFHLNCLSNGMFPSLAINFSNNSMTEEQMDKLERDVYRKFSSDENAGKIILTFSDDTANATTITPITLNDLDKRFEQLHADVLQNIMTSHQLTSPMLAGIKTAQQLGGRVELLEANELFFNKIIKKEQILILKSFNLINEINKNEKVKIKNIQLLENRFDDALMAQILTTDELREMINKNPLENKTETKDGNN